MINTIIHRCILAAALTLAANTVLAQVQATDTAAPHDAKLGSKVPNSDAGKEVGVAPPAHLNTPTPENEQQRKQALEANNSSAVQLAQPELSPNDNRQVKYFVLDNNLPVLLISDPKAEKAAAALAVNVGSGDDPLDRAGLAHFLEHMLFLGTEKYPNADEYQAYIQQQGGTHNAYTAIDHTNYFFEVNADGLAGALDRFAQFFIAPLFNEEYVERERKAVHSEFRAKFSSEYRRREDVLREVTNPEHPFGRFRTGNLETLHNNDGQLRKDLIAFYEQYYAASNMRLVVSGKEALEELQALVVPMFSAVKDFEVKHSPAPEQLYIQGLLPASINIVPYSEVRSVTYRFELPKNTAWMKKPTSYLGFLLGHEGEGSLYWLLQKQGWATMLSAGQSEGWRDGDTFSISVSLTPEGYANLKQVDALVFEQIDKVFKEGIDEWRFKEIKNLGEIDFRFKERGSLVSEVSHLASKMHNIDSSLLFSMDYRLSEFDEKLLRSFKQYINRENVLRIVTAPEVAAEGQKVTPLYDTPFSIDADYKPEAFELPKELVAGRALPEPNEFVPADLEMIEAENLDPVLVLKDSRFYAWHAQSNQFEVPKAITRIRIKSALVEQDMQHAALTALLSKVLTADLNPVAYQAAMAGANFSASATARGLDFTLSGYSDSLDPLLEYALKRIKLFGKGEGKLADADLVTSLQENLVRQYRNQKKATPYRQIMGHMAALMYSPYWEKSAMADAVEAITHEQLVEFTRDLLRKSEVTVLSAGNFDNRQAKRMAKKIKKALVKGRDFKPKTQAEVSVLKGVHALDILAEHEDNAVMLYLQGENDSVEEQANMELLAHMVSAPFYSQLRTEEQLGYIVFGSYYPIRDMPGLVFAVQSPTTDVEAIKKSMDAFLSSYTPDFATEFRVHQLALVAELSKEPKNLAEKTSRFWQSVNNADWKFDDQERLIDAVKAVEPKAFAKWYKTTLARVNKDLLVVYSQAQKTDEKKPVFEGIPAIQSAEQFKAGLETIKYP